MNTALEPVRMLVATALVGRKPQQFNAQKNLGNQLTAASRPWKIFQEPFLPSVQGTVTITETVRSMSSL